MDAVNFNYESDIFVSDYNEPLSDHYPVRVDFTWSQNESNGFDEGKNTGTGRYEDFGEPQQSEQYEDPKWAAYPSRGYGY